jgi:hypothetical protein
MKITIEDYHHTCADGCCHTYGYDLFVDGNKIGSFEDEDVHRLIELLNVWFNRLPKEAGMTKPDWCW